MDSTTSSLIGLVVGLIGIVGLWRVFTKAGRPGWGAIIPIFNLYLLVKTAGRPGWWVVLYLIPLVNIVVHAIVAIDLAKNFGKGKVFGIVGVWLFSIIGFLILGFGDARYVGPDGAVANQQRPAVSY